MLLTVDRVDPILALNADLEAFERYVVHRNSNNNYIIFYYCIAHDILYVPAHRTRVWKSAKMNFIDSEKYWFVNENRFPLFS